MNVVPKALKKCELQPQEIIPFLKDNGLLLDHGNLQNIPNLSLTGPSILRTDSRKVEKGDIFLAYKGVHADGHKHIAAALKKGACFIILEDKELLSTLGEGFLTPWAQVQNGRAVWAELASLAFGYPQKGLNILGVTGTNGKTSTVWMTAEILRHMGTPCLTIGTLGARLGGEDFPTEHTTPDPDVLFGLLHLAKERGVKVVAMEVSSHSLTQEKVRGLMFAASAFTSFSRDHLDFHANMDDYWEAKWKLFRVHTANEAPCFFADHLSNRLNLKNLPARSLIYGFDARLVAEKVGCRDFLQIASRSGGGLKTQVTFSNPLENISMTSDFFARHTLENLTAAALLAASVTGHFPSAEVLSKVRPVPGRLEPVHFKNGPTVLVDYAHTPDALEKTLQVLRPVCLGQLTLVFGCGGDRDAGKRPLMGQVAAQNADRVFVTSDNPRTEDPKKIIDDILSGFEMRSDFYVLPDRKEAIHQAIRMANSQDIVLIAGKGHESYQIIGHISHQFDDRVVAREALMSREDNQ